MKISGPIATALAALAVPVLLTGAPAFAVGPPGLQEAAERVTKKLPIEGLENLPKEMAFEKFIRYAYDDLVRWTEPSGKDLSFELRDFVHIPRTSFHTVQYSDIVTLPGGDIVLTARVRNLADWTDEVRVMYDPNWTTRREYLRTEEGQKAATLRLDAALEWGSRDEPRATELTDVTSFEVTVSLDGKDRKYRAAFGWIDREPHSHGISNVEAIFWDHVTVGVGETLGETAPLGDRESLPVPEGTIPASEERTPNVLGTKSTCEEGSGPMTGSLSSFLLYQSDNTGHTWGNHAVTGELDAECDCTSSCGQSCVPTMSNLACPEVGDTKTCHKISAPDLAAVSGTVSDTRIQGGADCGGGVACAWKACSGCICFTPTVSLSGSRSGPSISFTASATDGTVMKQHHNHLCNLCPLAGDDTSPTAPRDDDTSGGTCGDYTTPCTPIIINLGRDTIRLSGLDDPVQFDLDEDGRIETVSWTERGSDVAFLVYDRNGDGAVNSGYELFGSFTPQPSPPGASWNGFGALAAFDLDWMGGNEDGWVTPQDALFGDLRLWFDDDHDGVSQPHELFPLADYAIEAIELDPVEHRWRDRHGNELRYSSRVRFEGGGTTRAVDVIFLSR